jgi:Zn-finger nucleic acid-binding protein
VPSTTALRCLVACAGCKRQFDATGFATGSRFHCVCGAIIEVPRFRTNDAAVVRCSSCSAPRSKGARSCQHCGADYTLHEQDLHTVCPTCMTRVSDRARFCHHCATPIMVQGSVGQKTTQSCPECGRRHKMTGRSLGDPPVPVLECSRCAGLWLGREAFELVAERTRDRKMDYPTLQGKPSRPPSDGYPTAAQSGFYRQCPECRKAMNRRNFGRRSGIVIDSCKEHGIWFDARELDGVLKWIRKGGEERVERQEESEARHAESMQRFSVDREGRMEGWSRDPSSQGVQLEGLLGALFEL